MKNYLVIGIVATFSFIQSSEVNANQNLKQQQETLNMIGEFAGNFCQTAPITTSRMELTAEGKAEFSNFLKRLFGTDIEAVANAEFVQATGVLQDDLAKVIANSNECRLEIWRWLRKLIDVGGQFSGEIVAQPRIAELKSTLELEREGVVRRLIGGLEGMSRLDVADYLSGAIPNVGGGVTCDELQRMLRRASDLSRIDVIENVACYVRRPFPEECFRGISILVGSLNSRQALEALERSVPKY